jgi:hypothetical protein
MSTNEFANRLAARVEPRLYAPEIEPMMQDLLRTLANIDFEHDMELDKLERSGTDAALKQKIADKLKERHRERREPYIRHLTELQNRMLPRALAS